MDDLLLTTDCDNVDKCIFFLNQVCKESLEETEKYKKVYIDQSLNNANIELIYFLMQQGDTLIPLYKDYMRNLAEFKIVKEESNQDNNFPVEKYNQKVRQLNSSKNIFFTNFDEIQIEKKTILEKWYILKYNFIKRNL